MITCGDCLNFEYDAFCDWGHCKAPRAMCVLEYDTVERDQVAHECPCLRLKTCETCKHLAGIGYSLWCGAARNRSKPVDESTTCKRWRRNDRNG